MGRYEGAVCRHCRREGVKLFLKGEKCFTKCTLDRRAMPPGMHTQVRRRKVSDYGIKLRAKQRARRIYFLLKDSSGCISTERRRWRVSPA